MIRPNIAGLLESCRRAKLFPQGYLGYPIRRTNFPLFKLRTGTHPSCSAVVGSGIYAWIDLVIVQVSWLLLPQPQTIAMIGTLQQRCIQRHAVPCTAHQSQSLNRRPAHATFTPTNSAVLRPAKHAVTCMATPPQPAGGAGPTSISEGGLPRSAVVGVLGGGQLGKMIAQEAVRERVASGCSKTAICTLHSGCRTITSSA